MKKLFIIFSTLSLLLIAFVACNDSDLTIEQPTQESVMELRSTGTDATHYPATARLYRVVNRKPHDAIVRQQQVGKIVEMQCFVSL